MTPPFESKNNAMTQEDAFEHAIGLYQLQKKKEARIIFEQLLALSPTSLPLLQVLAVIDNEEGKTDAAIKKLDIALSIEPNNTSLLFDKAHLLAQQGINKEALEIVKQLLPLAPTNQELLSLHQALTASMGHRSESNKSAKQKKQLNEQKENALDAEIFETLELAHKMVSTGHTQEAASLFQAVISVAGENVEALLGLAKLQLVKEQFALARQTLLRAFDLKNPDKDILILLSHSNIKIGEYLSARKQARQGMIRFPKEAMFCRLMVQSYEKEKNWIEGYLAAKEGLRHFPNDADLLYRLAMASFNLLRTRHNFTQESIFQCQQHIERTAKISDDIKKFRLSTYLAEVLWYKGEAKKAKELLETYLLTFPDDIEIGFNISFIYRSLNEWENYYRANELGLTCGRRLKYSGDMPQWNFERPKDDTVLVMPEQGVGDELLYFHNLNLVLENAKKVYVACDPRLEKILSHAYPRAIMVPIVRIENKDIHIPEKVMGEITSWIAGGSLAGLCYARYGRHVYHSGYIHLPEKTKDHWHAKLADFRTQNPDALFIGLCWRSGLAAASRNIHYLIPDEVSHLMKQFPHAVFFNLQYGDCAKERKKIEKRSGQALVQLEGLDLRDDFESTAAVIAQLDAVITAGTAVHRLTTAVGKRCYVFFAGTEEDDFNVPQALNCENEWGYFYPPMLENKYPMLEMIAKHVQAQ